NATRNPRSGAPSWPSVFDATTRSSRSSNVPRRSITPQDATTMSSAPMGTPQRSCPGWAIISRAKKEPSNAVRPPRSQRMGLPRRSRGGEGASSAGGDRSLSAAAGSSALAATAGSADVGSTAAGGNAAVFAGAGSGGTAASLRLAGSIMKTTKAPRKQAAAPPQSSAATIGPAPTSLPDIIRTRLTATSAMPPMVNPRRAIPRGNDLGGSLLLVSLMGGAGGISNF